MAGWSLTPWCWTKPSTSKTARPKTPRPSKPSAAQHRFVLTGTPMENSVLDLWSIFDFLMPGYLGTAQDFRERYELPITREKDAAAQTRLARRLRPFLLRRLKQEVAADLPARLEQVSLCELTAEQRGVYQQVIASQPQGSAGSGRRAWSRQKPHAGLERLAAAAPGLLRSAPAEIGGRQSRQRLRQTGSVR